MDSVSSPELAKIFERVSDYVDVKGAYSAPVIEKRMNYTIEKCKTRVKIERAADRPRKSVIRNFAYQADQLDKLIEKGFPDRAIFEARKYPRGLIAQTLFYGKEEARRRIAAQRRARERFVRAYPRVGVRYRVREEARPRRWLRTVRR